MNDDAIPLAEARDLFPGRPTLQTLLRWHHTGVRGGRKLDLLLRGGRYFIRPSAAAAFLAPVEQEASCA